MVRLQAGPLGLDPGFGVLDAGDAADLLDFVREERGHAASRRRFPRAQTMLDIYSRTVNAQMQLAEVLAESFPWCAEHREALAGIFRAYGARKRSLGVIDLDDLLLYWRALALDERRRPAHRGRIRARARRRVPGRQRPAGRDRRAACARGARG